VSGCAPRAGAASHIGNYRENNEDFVCIDPKYQFALVLDGMGGLAAGELASRNGAEAVAGALREGLCAGEEPPGLIERALRAGHEAVRDLVRVDRSLRYSGTTVVLALLHRARAYVSWLGDSPAYLVSGGRIRKLTWEHDFRTALIRNGVLSPEEVGGPSIRNALYRYLGSDETSAPVDVSSFVPKCGDRLLLATDGITNFVPEPDLLRLCLAHPDPVVCAEELVDFALNRGSRDNCTCAVIAFGDPNATPPPARGRKWWRFWK
jgi:protein phosphatase